MKDVRVIYKTIEYQDFCNTLEDHTVRKIAYLETIIRKEKIISSKVVKKLVKSNRVTFHQWIC